MKTLNKILRVALHSVVVAYGASVEVMAFYFYSQAAERRSPSSLDWLSGGLPNVPIWEDKSFFRSIAWPYVIWFDKAYAREREAARQHDAVHRLVPLLESAARINDFEQRWTNTPIRDIPQSAFDGFDRWQSQILDDGPKIDVPALNQVYPQLGTMFAEKFLKSFQLVAEAKEHAGRSIDRSKARALAGNDERRTRQASGCGYRYEDT